MNIQSQSRLALIPSACSRLARKGFLAIGLCLALTACGGGSDNEPPAGHGTSSPLQAPSSLSYGTSNAVYSMGKLITPNVPTSSGGAVASYAVSPALPAGLVLNASSGAITGTPTAAQAQASYTVTATNSAGATQAQLQITVELHNVWTTMADLPGSPRHYAVAVKLQNGKLLVAGGISSVSGVSNEAALFDPSTDTWQNVPAMNQARKEARATLLLDGRVLVTGGDESTATTLSSAEIYDPAQNLWIQVGSMDQARANHTATLLPSGKVLVTGGYQVQTNQFLQSAEIYDPATATWTLASTLLNSARTQHAAELLPDGNTLLLIGGLNGGFLSSAELYPVSGSGSVTIQSNVISGGNNYRSAKLADGSILAVSDLGPNSFRYQPSTGTWSSALPGTSRDSFTLTTLPNGEVLLAGGRLGSVLTSTEIYNPSSNQWTQAAPMAQARRAATATLMDDGTVMMVGGYDGSKSLASVERYTP